ncbi:MAG TPA: hypothetical protein VIV11_19960, partial [Kofleriaceae bacterium]
MQRAMRLPIALLLASTPAFAQTPVPGTAGDLLRELMVEPALVNAELPVLAIHGGNPEDTVVLFDGFELPRAFHDSGLRSVIAPGSIGELELMPSGFGVEHGRGSSIVALSSDFAVARSFAELTALDATMHAWAPRRGPSAFGFRGVTGTVRYGRTFAAQGAKQLEFREQFGDLVARLDYRFSTPWSAAFSTFYSSSGFGRYIVAAHYKS